MRMTVGSIEPLVGTGSPDNVDVGAGVSVIVSIMVGASVAEGVASPNTCVPLLKISNICVMATGFPFSSTVDMVTL